MYKDINGDNWYKVQLHMHTSDSDGRLSPEAAAELYKNDGFDVIAITDHWKYRGEGELSGIRVISGCEYNMGASDTAVDVMHIVGVGMDADPQLVRGHCTRQQVIDKIKEKGGMPIFAHPAWSLNTVAQAKELNGFEAVEIYNAVSDVGQSRRAYSGYIVDALANEGIVYPIIATDDAHYYEGEDDRAAYIMVKAKSDSKEDILSAIRGGELYSTQGPSLVVKREGDRITAECSECVEICFLSNLSWVPDRVICGERLTHGEYKIKPLDKWVRVEIKDKHGKCAWSNIITIQ